MPFDPINRTKKQGTGYSNIQSLLQANRPQKIANAIGSGLQSGINQSKGAITSAKNKLKGQLEPYTSIDEGTEAAWIDRAMKDPMALNSDQENKLSTIGKGYTGPKNLDNINTASAEEAGNLARTPEGRAAALKRYVGKSGYTSGQQRLDQLLLGKASSGAFKQAKLGAAQVQGEKTAAENQAKTDIGNAQGMATNLQGHFQDVVTKQAKDLGTDLETRTGTAQNNFNHAKGTIDQVLAGEPITQKAYDDALQTFADLGIDITKEMPVYSGMNEAQRANFFGPGPRALTSEDIATQKDRERSAKLGALGAMAGLHGESTIKTLGEKQAYDPFALSEDTKTTLSDQIKNQMNAEAATPEAGASATQYLSNVANIALMNSMSGKSNPNDLKALQGEDRDIINRYSNSWEQYYTGRKESSNTGGLQARYLDNDKVKEAKDKAYQEGLKAVIDRRNSMNREYNRQSKEIHDKYSPKTLLHLLNKAQRKTEDKGIGLE